MQSFFCHKCGRAISADAPRCLWCGAAMGEASQSDPTAFIEMEYASGIERLTDPTPVRLTVHSDGVHIREVMPGTRSIWIEAGQIIEARLSGSMIAVGKRSQSRWPFIGAFFQGRKRNETSKRNYTLTITYREEDRVHSAVFHREDASPASPISRIARMISALARKSEE